MKLGKFSKLICAAAAVAVLTFTGCGTTEESTGEINTQITEAAANHDKNSGRISDNRNTSVVNVAKTVGPAVVGITNRGVARDMFNRQVAESTSWGSGVIFRNDGYIVTNNHVISDSQELIVSLADGRTFNGKLVGADELTDIAVVKIDAKDLPTAKFGNSDDIMVGETAIAIGNPMGLEYSGSVTVGVISALNRTISSDAVVSFLQTDAAINQGNSGGALVNADGELIGIPSVKIVRSGFEGMAFAIPINTVKNVVDELVDKGYVARPYLGVKLFDKPTAARYGYSLSIDKGVYIFQVELGSSADRAGLQRDDVILSIDGRDVNSVSEARAAINTHKVGDTIKITYVRDRTTHTVEVVLQEMPASERQ
ncbi:MAG: trypsin-like peptidase domain-containing protein [Selenomonadaceae bacterium]|nr:trypsin-like peptidase domain-containing protein [Selenomonadaceae bacterium]